mgnify:FL=1
MVRHLAQYWNHLAPLNKLVNRLEKLGQRALAPRAAPVRRAAQLHPDKVTELLESYRSGTPSLTLAAEFGINESTVYAHIERSGVDRRPYRKLHGADLERARRLYESGTSLRAVAAEVGCSVSAVHSRLVELGVRMRPRR